MLAMCNAQCHDFTVTTPTVTTPTVTTPTVTTPKHVRCTTMDKGQQGTVQQCFSRPLIVSDSNLTESEYGKRYGLGLTHKA